jgi:hypothetical protein
MLTKEATTRHAALVTTRPVASAIIVARSAQRTGPAASARGRNHQPEPGALTTLATVEGGHS